MKNDAGLLHKNFETSTESMFHIIANQKLEELEPLINFLFIVHNDIEMSEMISTIEPICGYDKIIKYVDSVGSKQSYYLGKFCCYNIALIQQADMGYAEINSTINVLNSAISLLKPRFIVMPGIAASMDNEVKIGDVVIVNKILGYEIEKRKISEVIGRNPAYTSPRMYNLFNGIIVKNFNNKIKQDITEKRSKSGHDDGEFSWESIASYGFPKLHKGTMISGEKLVDDPVFKATLKNRFKEAKALDMEGLGVASASVFNRVYDWIVVKGISDLGDGKKNDNKDNCQIYAMRNAISVLREIFSDCTAFTTKEMKVDYRQYSVKKVLISSSQCSDGENSNITAAFLWRLSSKLIQHDMKVISGYGRGVGPIILAGIFEGLRKKGLSIELSADRYDLFPYPRNVETNTWDSIPELKNKISTFKSINRKMLCSSADIFVFAFGQKNVDGYIEPQIADGMLEELMYAANKKALIVPIPCTGGTARKIYNDTTKTSETIQDFYANYFNAQKQSVDECENAADMTIEYLESLKKLDTEITIENMNSIVDTVIDIINRFR